MSFFEKQGFNISLILIVISGILIIYGILNGLFYSILGWILFAVAGNVRLVWIKYFGQGFIQKISNYLLIIFNLLIIGWSIEFATGLFTKIF